MHKLHYAVMLLFCFACTDVSTDSSLPAKEKALTIIVGSDSLFQEDIGIRKQILALNKEGESPSLALFQLTKMLILKNIAKKRGFELTPQYLELETTRIDSSTWEPETIAKIKAICQNEIDLYQRVFVQESLLPRWLYLNYSWNKDIHYPIAEKATNRFGKVLINPTLMDKDSTILEFWLTTDSLWNVDTNLKKEEPPSTDSFIDLSKKENQVIEANINQLLDKNFKLKVQQLNDATIDLKEGQLHPRLLELQDAFWILKLEHIEKERKRIKIISISKQNYFEWLTKESKQVNIEVVDEDLWQSMVEDVPQAKEQFNY